MADTNVADRWISVGAASLVGDPDGPCLLPPDGVVQRILGLGAALDVDPLVPLVERAAFAGLARRGATSAGGGSRLIPAADAWLAVTMARDEDVALVPAWLGIDRTIDDPWPAITAAVADRASAALVARGRELGLPVARVGEVVSGGSGPRRSHRLAAAAPLGRPPLVVDLSSLWSGPLCARLLGHRGADVVKVESSTRPDGAREGDRAFYDHLHAGHRSVALDFTHPMGRRRLRALLEAADVVIEGSRPRALAQLGVDPAAIVPTGPRVWVSITAHGRDAAEGLAGGFGDDAAAGGGLVAWGADGAPRFFLDAVADPLTGMVATATVLELLEVGGRHLVDLALARVAAEVAASITPGRSWTELDPAGAPAPVTPPVAGVARPLGADTDEVLRELGIR